MMLPEAGVFDVIYEELEKKASMFSPHISFSLSLS